LEISLIFLSKNHRLRKELATNEIIISKAERWWLGSKQGKSKAQLHWLLVFENLKQQEFRQLVPLTTALSNSL
jgi:hypothetical protein